MGYANIHLKGGKVTPAFQLALFDAANRAGMTVNEFVLMATAERLVARGVAIPGVFRPGDIKGTMAA
ncbi:hypothetical protein SAMN06297251_112106 [Fulvimarina manganoxydans]|uniref:HicB family protein n=1 Tax=Fulvimarina manganoxydans TaxID=937218 RepID=A0A1W2D3J6_9HYPH|nr:hypothetical protein [Fulvimarina manganoxydans]SMC92100.1 hypothetical protein SAMN06297251_112106 [Fulvimarina manganoxydans]